MTVVDAMGWSVVIVGFFACWFGCWLNTRSGVRRQLRARHDEVLKDRVSMLEAELKAERSRRVIADQSCPELAVFRSDAEAIAAGEAEGVRLHHEWALREHVTPCGCSPTCTVDHPLTMLDVLDQDPERAALLVGLRDHVRHGRMTEQQALEHWSLPRGLVCAAGHPLRHPRDLTQPMLTCGCPRPPAIKMETIRG